MAENKRIRVSADASPLQELRQQVTSIWNEFISLENRFKGVAESTLDVLQKQIDLLSERNALMSGGGFTAGGGGSLGSSFRNAERSGGGTGFNSVFERINDGVKRIADILEKTHRDETNVLATGGVPTGGGSNASLGALFGGGAGKAGKGSTVALMGSLLNGGAMSMLVRAIPWAAVLMGVGKLIGSIYQGEVTKYNMGDQFDRANWDRNRSWWLRTFDFTGISAANYEKEAAQLNAARQATGDISKYASLYGMTFNAANAVGASGLTRNSEYERLAAEANELERKYPTRTVREWVENFGDDGGRWVDKKIVDPRVKAAVDRAAAAYNNQDYEQSGWASRVLGLNYAQYLSQLSDYGRAAAYGWNSTTGDINQLLMAEKIRGLSAGDAQGVLRTARFGTNLGYSGANVVQAIDTALAGAGFSNQYISSTLPEYLQLYNTIGNTSLGKVGRINSEAIVRAITGIQRSTGAEGKQLERLTNALTGGSVSSDDVTQAMLLRTARQLAPNASYSDLMAMKENMANDTALQKKFFENTYRATGGGDRFRSGLVSMYGLSWSDAKLLDESIQKAGGFEKGFDFWKRGTTRGAAYSESAAAAMISDVDKSRAGTENEKIVEGFKTMMPEFASMLAVETVKELIAKAAEANGISKQFANDFADSLARKPLKLKVQP